jgi:hypothetical protein
VQLMQTLSGYYFSVYLTYCDSSYRGMAHFVNLSTFLDEGLYHSFMHLALIFRDFDYQKLIFVQNKYDIRNQHQKLHCITCSLF